MSITEKLFETTRPPGWTAQLEDARLRFEAGWVAGRQPRLEEYLAQVPAEDRGALFGELLTLELVCRRRAGQEPLVEEYLGRFPDFAASIPTHFRQGPPTTDALPTEISHLPSSLEPTEKWASPAPGAPGEFGCATTMTPTPGNAGSESLPVLQPPQEPDEIGRLGAYRVLKKLGAGGMGIVFRAEDTALQRPVALKVMKPSLAADLNARTRFLREARAAAALNNDHVVTIYQVGMDHDVPYLAMEFLEGEPLDSLLERDGRVPADETIRIGREAALGLAAAHERGLVHRDIKPGNLWLEAPNARVKLLDFGLARVSAEDLRLTQTGVVVGTPAYMAPEQAADGAVDGRCDLFSLGCVLYRLCTGQAPFRGGHLIAMLTAIAIEQPAAPHDVDPQVPRPLSDLIMAMLAKDPAARPASARAVVETLAELEIQARGEPRPPARRRSSSSLASIVLPQAADDSLSGTQASRSHTWEPLDGPTVAGSEAYLSQLRLLLEELACDLCRFEHVLGDQLAPESVCIDREFPLGPPGLFADVRVAAQGLAPYFVEVKHGYSNDRLVRSLRRKYGQDSPALAGAGRVVLVVDVEGRADWPRVREEIVRVLGPRLTLEVWDEARLIPLLRDRFGVQMGAVTETHLIDARQAIDRAKGFHAFGNANYDDYHENPLHAQLLWHFGFWRLRQLRDARRLAPRDVLPPGLYHGVAVLIADLCGFTGYVRDTRDAEVIRDCLTSFYSKARYHILNNGGMVYQFVEDQVIALFGLPDPRPQYLLDAFKTAQGLIHVGRSVSNHWQRHIDREQPAAGLHIGLAVGDVQIVPLRPFSRTHFGAIGDPISVAARLLDLAGPSEIAASNSFYQGLPEDEKTAFREADSVEAPQVGRIKAWKVGR